MRDISNYLVTREELTMWYNADPEGFPYFNPNLTKEEEKRLDNILRALGENI